MRSDVQFDFRAIKANREKLMIREQATISKEVHDVLLARWAGFKRLAREFERLQKHHHILGVELLRTLKDETVAVFTVLEKGEIVRYVVNGDSKGRVRPPDCPPPPRLGDEKGITHAAHAMEARVAAADPTV